MQTFARKFRVALYIVLVLSAAVAASFTNQSFVKSNAQIETKSALVPGPEAVLGFRPGDDRKLASWGQVIEYFQKLAAASNRVKFAELGRTTMGAPFVMATISAPENLAHLDEYRKVQEMLADPRTLGPDPDQKAAELIARGKTIVLITCGIHSDEVGSYLSSMLIAHRLASSDEPEIQEILRNTIILLVPSLNPDGVDIVKNWYDRTLGTPYEGTDPPQLYHKFTGHDDNRDWYAFTQIETQIAVDKIHNVWHPQIVHDIHQQGEYGSRLFLPPYMKPVEPNVPKQIIEGYTELGGYIAREMRAAGFKGITTDSTYDAWSPSRAYSHYHGGVRILSETASCKIATPLTIKFDELQPGQGYDPRKDAANFGPVWRGGEWRLRDITNHMTTAAFLLLKHAAQHRERWLSRFYEIGKEAVRPRAIGELSGFSILPSGNSAALLKILQRGGVELVKESGTSPRNEPKSKAIIVPVAQPYGSFAKAVLETQQYPNLRNDSGLPQAPYDVTAHTLTLLMGVDVRLLYTALGQTLPAQISFLADSPLSFDAKVAVYKSHVPTMDEGWTRWSLENDHGPMPYSFSDLKGNPVTKFRYTVLEDTDLRRGASNLNYRTIVIPDQPRHTILNGYRPGTMPAEYTGGLGEEGVQALRDFVEKGGTIVCLNRASDFAIEQFKLPLRDVVADLPRTDFYVPGSILRIELDTSNPIAKGMPQESIAWAENSPVFEIIKNTSGNDEVDPANVHIIATYPKDSDPLLSGWLLGGDRIKGKAALVEVTLGKGHIILFGFRPQYRGQSLATYPLFFNAITYK
jgi:hypothetical protein